MKSSNPQKSDPPATYAARFRYYRERAGLSEAQMAAEVSKRFGYTDPRSFTIYTLGDLEAYDDELFTLYSPREIWHFSRIFGINAQELLNLDGSAAPVTAPELVQLIKKECATRNLSLEQFEDVVGWRLSVCMNPPELLLQEMTLDGMTWLCQELHIDWRGVITDMDSSASSKDRL
ncbi:MAG: hypothetical protein EPN97_10490 [Alphaproteobacteria bacterium]|nr:MAG: hypothetical protein EPN97_10490 [Alphaproteobacteria bacterium]